MLELNGQRKIYESGSVATRIEGSTPMRRFLPARVFIELPCDLFRKKRHLKSPSKIDALASAADSASSLVFIVIESEKAYRACRSIVDFIDKNQRLIHDDVQLTSDDWLARSNYIAHLLRKFQAAIRDELGVGGIEESLILTRKTKPKSTSAEL